LAERNYHLARAYYMYELHRKRRQLKGSPLIIYNMGKVGSKTVQRSLKALGVDMPIYHVHFLTQDLIDQYIEKRKEFVGTKQYGRLKHIWLYQYLREQIDRGLADTECLDSEKWKLVTLTREPISRNISEFFETLEAQPLDEAGQRYYVKSDPDFYDFEIVVDLDDLSGLVQVYLDRLDHDTPLRFFDEQLRSVFGIDVFASEFPASKGYKIYEADQADVLLIRVENLNGCAAEAFKEFLGIQDLVLINENIGSQKPYAALYRKFKESITLPESYVDRMYNSKYMQHFYSKEEIARFRTKWQFGATSA
jgi:hypothetical protein